MAMLRALVILLVAIGLAGCGRGAEPTNGGVKPAAGTGAAPASAKPAPATPAPGVQAPGPSVANGVLFPDMPGNTAALRAALAEPSPVRYRIEVAPREGITDRTGYLDQLLESRQWPEPPMLVLLLFPADNYDIRFAMGTIFHGSSLSVGEMLALVRTHYFPAVRAGDPAAGLAQLIREVNQQMVR